MDAIDLTVSTATSKLATGASDAMLHELHGESDIHAHPRGIPELRDALATKLWRHNGLVCDPESNIFVTSGITTGITASLLALCQPGDEVLLPEPCLSLHIKLIRAAGMVPRTFPVFANPLTRAQLSAAVTPKTRAIVLCTPANPSGKVYTAAELEALADVARTSDLWVITDEQYEELCFDGHDHVSPASVADLGQRTVSNMGFCQTLSNAGWRMGYIMARGPVLESVASAYEDMYMCPPTELQSKVAAALRQNSAPCRGFRDDLQQKRDRLCRALTHAGFVVTVPQAGFFVLAEAPFANACGENAAMELLLRTRVAAAPSYRGLLRFSFAKSDLELAESCRRLRNLQRD